MEPKHLEHNIHESNQEMDHSQGNKKTRNEKSDKRKMMPKDPKLCDIKNYVETTCEFKTIQCS